MSRLRIGRVASALLLASLATTPAAEAGFQVAVTFNDPGGAYSSYYGGLATEIEAAGADWSRALPNTAGVLTIQVDFANIPTVSSASTTSVFAGTDGPYSVLEQGALAKVTPGVGSPGASPDAVINVGTGYLNRLYFDPAPDARTAPIPYGKVDALSVFIHEFGHILVFNGFRNAYNGTLPGGYESTFDALTAFDGTNFYFTGPRAEAIYGGPVPLTFGNIFHLGNGSRRPGSDLLSDLMNGVVYYPEHRYDISPLDLAIVEDTGITLRAVPEPSSLALLVAGASVLAVHVRRRRSRPAA